MMNSKVLTGVLVLLFSLHASAALLSGAPGDASVKYTYEKDGGALTLIGKGQRKKTFIGVKVYDMSVYAADAATFDRDPGKALDSLGAQKAVAIQMKFLRDVTSEQIVQAFKEGLEANKIDPNSAALKESLAKIQEGGPTKNGETMTLLGLSDGKTDRFFYENGSGKVFAQTAPAGHLKQIYSIWYGVMSEGRMEDLKKSLLAKP